MPLPSTRVVHPNRTGEVGGALDQVRPSTATIKRRVYAKSATGGDTETLQTIARDVPVRIRLALRRAQQKDIADRPSDRSQWTLAFPAGTDVAAFDRVLADGRTFDVASVHDESLGPELSALCVEVIS